MKLATLSNVSVEYLKALQFIEGYKASGATIRPLPPLTPGFDAARSPQSSPRSGAQSPVEAAVVDEQAASSFSPTFGR